MSGERMNPCSSQPGSFSNRRTPKQQSLVACPGIRSEKLQMFHPKSWISLPILYLVFTIFEPLKYDCKELMTKPLLAE